MVFPPLTASGSRALEVTLEKWAELELDFPRTCRIGKEIIPFLTDEEFLAYLELRHTLSGSSHRKGKAASAHHAPNKGLQELFEP